jgi:hypothetical protein
MSAEAERLARVLGGGWSLQNGVLPRICLTVPEAQALESRINELEDQVTELERYGPHDES